jgi:flagellar biosynthesis protein FlhG
MTAVIAMTSGKAGVGQSLLSANLAQYLNAKGHRTGLLAAGDPAPLWGVEPNTAWPELLDGRLPLPQAIHRDVFGVDLMLAGGHGHILERLRAGQAPGLEPALGQLEDYAYLIIDLAAGSCTPALACCLAASETILLLTPERTVLNASFEWLIHLARHGCAGPVHVILNQIRKPALAQSLFIRFRDLAQKRFKLQIDLWGAMGLEAALDPDAIRRRPLAQEMPQSRLLRDIHAIGDRLTAEQPAENQTRPLTAFWQQFVERLEQLPPLQAIPGRPEKPPADTQAALQAPRHRPESAAPALQDEAETAEAQPGQLALVHAQLTEITRELSAIHRLLEIGPEARREERSRPANEILLDFDAFLGRHQPGESR